MAALSSVKQCLTLIFSWTISGHFIESTVVDRGTDYILDLNSKKIWTQCSCWGIH